MRFEGDFDHLWRIGHRPPIRRLTWDWWWWLIMLDGGSGPDAQVMALWSTKDTPSIDVNGRPWSSEGRPRSTATRQVLSVRSVPGTSMASRCTSRSSRLHAGWPL